MIKHTEYRIGSCVAPSSAGTKVTFSGRNISAMDAPWRIPTWMVLGIERDTWVALSNEIDAATNKK